jgi:ArsR family transcriptional regulator
MMLTSTQVKEIQREIGREEEKLPAIFSALSDPGRFRIFKLLMEYRDLCVTDIAGILRISVPAASQQLRILELAGLVRRERMGQMICYEVKSDNPLVKSIIKLVSGF